MAKAMAMDIGKEVASYIEIQYPEAVEAASSTFLLSVRNSIYNQIVEAMKQYDPDEISRWLEHRKDSRRKSRAQWKKLRNGTFYPGMPVEEYEIATKAGLLAPEDELT